jgi:hypothetical protein
LTKNQVVFPRRVVARAPLTFRTPVGMTFSSSMNCRILLREFSVCELPHSVSAKNRERWRIFADSGTGRAAAISYARGMKEIRLCRSLF